MPKPVPRNHPLRRLFEGLTQQTFFEELGIADVRLADYLADLLSRFVHVDNIYRIRDARGKPLEEVAEMLMEAWEPPSSDIVREREIHKHIGDFTLFWVGVYPENLRFLRAPYKKDHLLDYTEQGRKSYLIASRYDTGGYREEARVLRRLSEEFELCAFGLSLVRKGWEKLDPESSSRIRNILK